MEVFSLFWPMPRLVRLDLEGTVAVNFDLGSLEHCPVLQELRLNVARKIPSDWNPRSKVTQLARVSHHLRQLELSGWWGLCDEDLTRTLLSVLKRLYGLNLMWCRGPSNSCFLELLPQLTGLFSLAVSATPWEQSQLQHLKCSLALQMEIDVQIVE
ncbi:hypothetical protein EDD11_007316 [Mortierella claussenii]|nr:hypothetical protein EDD11_007316 [Mortierella claussenii]